jgi:hypothetical protein
MISQLIPVINLGHRTFNVIAPSISTAAMLLLLLRLCNLFYQFACFPFILYSQASHLAQIFINYEGPHLSFFSITMLITPSWFRVSLSPAACPQKPQSLFFPPRKRLSSTPIKAHVILFLSVSVCRLTGNWRLVKRTSSNNVNNLLSVLWGKWFLFLAVINQ